MRNWKKINNNIKIIKPNKIIIDEEANRNKENNLIKPLFQAQIKPNDLSKLRILFPNNYSYINTIDLINNTSQPIKNNNFTYVCLCRKDALLVAKTMEHRINWTPLFINNYNPQMTKQMTNYNFKCKYGPKNVEYKKLAKSNDNLDKQKVKI